MTIAEAFGLALRKCRNRKGLSQEELASQSGLHRTYISLLERGKKGPSLSTVFRVSGALGVSPHVLVAMTEQVLNTSGKEKEADNEGCQRRDSD